MKNLLLSTVLMAAMALVACGQNKNDHTTKVGRTGFSNAPSNPASNFVGSSVAASPGMWGNITPASQQAVVDFVSSGIPQADVGQVLGCQTAAHDQCQVRFNISVAPPSNFNAIQLMPNPQAGNTLTNNGGAVLTIAIYDSVTGSFSQTAGNLPISAIASTANLASAMVDPTSGSVILTFNSSSGSVQLQGGGANTFNLSGTVNFVNSVNVNNPSAVNMQETLGSFTTNTCYAFQCAQ